MRRRETENRPAVPHSNIWRTIPRDGMRRPRRGSRALIRAELLLLAAALGGLIPGEAEGRQRRVRAVIETCAGAPFSSAELLQVLPLELGREVTLVQTSTAIDLLLAIGVIDCGKSSR